MGHTKLYYALDPGNIGSAEQRGLLVAGIALYNYYYMTVMEKPDHQRRSEDSGSSATDKRITNPNEERSAEDTIQLPALTASRSASGHTSLQPDDNRSQILTSLPQGGVQPADAERIYTIYLQEASGAIPLPLPPRTDWDAYLFASDSAGPSAH